jgi:hypothetical protein
MKIVFDKVLPKWNYRAVPKPAWNREVISVPFLSGDPIALTTYFETAVNIHHIFPRAYCERQKYDRQRWNSIVNKAPLSARTNRIIGGKAPSEYLRSLEKNRMVSPDSLDDILKTHLIEPGLLRDDAFEAFTQDRARRLLDLIENATGKPSAGRDSEEVIRSFGGSLARVQFWELRRKLGSNRMQHPRPGPTRRADAFKPIT